MSEYRAALETEPPQTVKELQAYIAGMKAALRLIFGKEVPHGPA